MNDIDRIVEAAKRGEPGLVPGVPYARRLASRAVRLAYEDAAKVADEHARMYDCPKAIGRTRSVLIAATDVSKDIAAAIRAKLDTPSPTHPLTPLDSRPSAPPAPQRETGSTP